MAIADGSVTRTMIAGQLTLMQIGQTIPTSAVRARRVAYWLMMLCGFAFQILCLARDIAAHRAGGIAFSCLLVAFSVWLMTPGARDKLQRGWQRVRQPRLMRPPLYRIDALMRTVCSTRTYDRVFKPMHADAVFEWQQATVAGQHWRARFVHLRSLLGLVGHVVSAALRKVRELLLP